MTIDDIIRFFSVSSDGQRMAPDEPAAGILNQVSGAGAGRGFSNPAVVDPSAPRPTMNAGAGRGFNNPARVNPSSSTPLQPLPVTEIATLPPIASVMAGQDAPYAMRGNAADVVVPNGPQPLQGMKQYEQGILSKAGEYLNNQLGFDQPDFVSRLGNALAVAGSQDPTKALLQLQQNRAEGAKMSEARRRANQPKFDPIAGTPFTRVTTPDGRFFDVRSEALSEYYKSQSESKANQKVEDAVLQDRLARGRDSTKADIKAADTAEPQLKQVQEQLAAITEARSTLPRMGKMDQLKGAAGPVGDFAASMADPQMNIDSQKRAAVRVLDWVRSSEPLKGALSNVEGLKLDMPLPKPSAAKEEWEAYFDNSERVLKEAQKYYEKQVERRPSSTGQSPSGASPGGMARPSSKSEYDQLPSGTRYVAPNGQVLIKK